MEDRKKKKKKKKQGKPGRHGGTGIHTHRNEKGNVQREKGIAGRIKEG